MNRRKFIRHSCVACVSGTALAIFSSSCISNRYIQGELKKDGLEIDAREFEITNAGKKTYRPYIIVRNDALQFPVCVYRFAGNEYSAVWMQCTHQGAELQVAGDRLQCSAHGSEFDNKGTVKSGPAQRNLRNFPVTVINDQSIFIDLRAI